MSSIDLIVVLVYLTGSIAIGLWAARSRASIGDYVLGGRDLPAGANLLSIAVKAGEKDAHYAH